MQDYFEVTATNDHKMFRGLINSSCLNLYQPSPSQTGALSEYKLNLKSIKAQIIRIVVTTKYNSFIKTSDNSETSQQQR